MRKILMFGLIVLQTAITLAQKKLVTDTTYLHWTTVSNGLLSNNGKYACYQINNSLGNKIITVITSTDLSWEKRYTNLTNGSFDSDSRYFFALNGDTLLQIELGHKSIVKTPNCKEYQLFTNRQTDYLIYHLKDTSTTLFVKDNRSGKELRYTHVQKYMLNKKGGALIMQRIGKQPIIEELVWLNLPSGESQSIWTGQTSTKHIFDPQGEQMAFTTETDGLSSIYLYRKGEVAAQKLVDDDSQGIADTLKISTSEVWFFDNKGERIFLTLKEKTPASKHEEDDPEVWSYLDQIPYPQYQKSRYMATAGSGKNLTVIDIPQKKIRQLLSNLQRIADPSQLKMRCDSVFVYFDKIIKNKSLPDDGNNHMSYYLYFIGSGKSIPLKLDQAKGLESDRISPENKYIVYFDPTENVLFSYNIATRVTKNISAMVAEFGRLDISRRKKTSPPTLLGWLATTNCIWINGSYDLYQLDLDGIQPPLNLTQNVGERNKKVFAFNGELSENGSIDNHKEHIVWAFDLATKQMDFYKLDASKQNLMKIYSTNQYARNPGVALSQAEFCKAVNAEAYLFKFESVHESPNFHFTNDFKKFTDISNVHPECGYNWFYSELMTYKDLDGNDCQGILYKPENFDPKKKYPVITYIYQEQANKLHQFISPEPGSVGINIPILISKGYLVFKPNVYQVNGNFNQTLTSVLAGMDCLIKYDWVDSKNLALFGHSLGGYETSYIITKTNRFKAAVAAAPITNATSVYNDHFGGGEIESSYIRTFLSDRLEIATSKYVEYSPILHAQNIFTPLLLMHNRDDGAAKFYHSNQMFNQLRSLQKPVWLVSYKNEGHSIGNLNNQLDFQRKAEGYFDHYLKGMPMPQWMNQAIKLE